MFHIKAGNKEVAKRLQEVRMGPYPKIQTLYKRDEDGVLMEGQFSKPEFQYLQDNIWVFTEKVDGTSIRISWDGKVMGIQGRTNKSQVPCYLIDSLQDIFLPLYNEFQELFKEIPICLYGEGYGAKVQKGGGDYKGDSQGFVLFDVKVGKWWLQRKDIGEIAERLGLDVVPIIGGIGTLGEMVELVKRKLTSSWGPFPAKGIVARPFVELQNRAGRRIITKLETKDFY